MHSMYIMELPQTSFIPFSCGRLCPLIGWSVWLVLTEKRGYLVPLLEGISWDGDGVSFEYAF